MAAGILEISAGVLAERGEAASMADIAAAAGVARATLYRYFPNRDVLVRALTETALTDLAGRIADAKLDEVPVEVAIARMTRAVVATISKYQGLALFQKALEDPPPAGASAAERRLIEPLRRQFERGASEGAFRRDLPTQALFKVYVGLVEGVASLSAGRELGVEQASAAITAIFLTGALTPQSRTGAATRTP
ncbi:hypothetical protein GCM10023259_041490 [Thermocatellispora tengchongensis]